jgi:ATP-dependent helicase HepA
VVTRDHTEAVVRAVAERDGLLYYDCGDGDLCETELSHTLSFSSPVERLFAAQFDPSPAFDLRAAALRHQADRRRSEVRGFTGGRIDLLPHQLGIAAEVTGRLIPRVLLADEVGLGKTIEACLIVHRLLLTGRARRVLIIVPETLVHQWFLELLRRFNLWFHIFNEARCVAIEESARDVNPFLDDQLVLCELSLFTDNEGRLDQALAAGWDLVVVDEAHHLEWSPGAASPEYAAVERLGQASQGLLLLTATPEQLGVASHFARLRLLDPDRFHDLSEFMRETSEYAAVARLARLLREGRTLAASDAAELAARLGEPADSIAERWRSGDAAIREAWVERLLDQHGTGRVMFRNTRATITGFPSRRTHLYPLVATSAARFAAIADEWDADTDSTFSFAHDPRIEWLVSLLQSLAPLKVLLICRTQRKALAIESALKQRTTLPLAAFHEGLTLVQRDRGAAWFADPDGARLLICSEIGSEGRNFQFAHHLVLFDLPIDPALLEQRIGRLDRIGQREQIHIHVPFVTGTHLEVLARWYHEGLNAFDTHLPGARELLERFDEPLRALATRARSDRRRVAAELEPFLESVRAARHDVAVRLEQGRDRLLEWNSLRPALATRIVEAIRAQDDDRTLDEFMLAVFDLFVIQVEEVAPRTYRLGSAGVLVDDFPGLKAEGLTCTRDRQRALQREDLQFLTWDHPLATGALDVLLGSERGNCSVAKWPDSGTAALYLEALFVLECLAPDPMHVDRFLPPTPVRVVVDHRGRDAGAELSADRLGRQAEGSTGRALLARPEIRDTALPRMIDRARVLAEARVPTMIERARQAMRARLQHEAARLRELQKVNRTVRDDEIALLEEQEQALARVIDGARLRLDALRLVYRGR